MLALPDIHIVLDSPNYHLFVAQTQQHFTYMVLLFQLQLQDALIQQIHLVTVLNQRLDCVLLSKDQQPSLYPHNLSDLLPSLHLQCLDELGVFEMVKTTAGCEDCPI